MNYSNNFLMANELIQARVCEGSSFSRNFWPSNQDVGELRDLIDQDWVSKVGKAFHILINRSCDQLFDDNQCLSKGVLVIL